MTSYVLFESGDNAYHAGPKARRDITQIAVEMGFVPLEISRREGGKLVDKLAAIPVNIHDWLALINTTTTGDILLIQFPLPMYPQVARTAIPMLKWMHNHGRKIILVLHDLNMFRGYRSAAEYAFLKEADCIIAHNEIMKLELKKRGIVVPIETIGVFDYLVAPDSEESQCESGIDIAGNLSPQKAGYVYAIPQRFPNAQIQCYGPNFDELGYKSVSLYRGSFPPEQLAAHLHGKFGLVWDGESLETCSGNYGNYLRINNPHKLSMYIAMGKPVIIWNEAAEASFVQENQIGIAVGSIGEAVNRVEKMSEQEWSLYHHNILKLRKLVISGSFTKKVFKRAEERITR